MRNISLWSLDPFFCGVEQEGNFLWFLNWVIIWWPWYAYSTWKSRNIMSLSLSLCELLSIFNWHRFISQVVSTTHSFKEVMSWSWFHFNWSQWTNRLSKSILIILSINFTSYLMIISWCAEVFFSISFWYRVEISLDFILSRSWLNTLLLIRSRVRVVEINSDNFLWHWILELSCTHIFLFISTIKSISLIIGSWGWLQLVLN